MRMWPLAVLWCGLPEEESTIHRNLLLDTTKVKKSTNHFHPPSTYHKSKCEFNSISTTCRKQRKIMRTCL